MNWFKHMTHAHDDEALISLVDQLGLEAYARYWLVLEAVAGRSKTTAVSGAEEFTLTLPTKEWCSILHTKPQQLRRFWEATGNLRLCYGEPAGNLTTTTVPKLAKIRDSRKKLTKEFVPRSRRRSKEEEKNPPNPPGGGGCDLDYFDESSVTEDADVQRLLDIAASCHGADDQVHEAGPIIRRMLRSSRETPERLERAIRNYHAVCDAKGTEPGFRKGLPSLLKGGAYRPYAAEDYKPPAKHDPLAARLKLLSGGIT